MKSSYAKMKDRLDEALVVVEYSRKHAAQQADYYSAERRKVDTLEEKLVDLIYENSQLKQRIIKLERQIEA